MTQEPDIEPEEPPAPPRVYFWRGPIVSENQAKDIISWAGCSNLILGMLLLLAATLSIMHHDPGASHQLWIGIEDSIPGLLLWRLQSRFAAILQLFVHCYFMLSIVMVELRTGVPHVPIIIGSCLIALLLLDWRAIRATLAWQRMKIERHSAVASMFG